MRFVFLIFILLAAIFVGSTTLANKVDASQVYKRPVISTNNGGEVLTDFQILISLNNTNFDYTHLGNPNGDDIRFTTDSTCIGLPDCSYWIESWKQGPDSISNIFVKIPSINAGLDTIYMCYGNQSASKGSNGDSTFGFFEDFLGNDIDTNVWTFYMGRGTVYDTVHDSYYALWSSSHNSWGRLYSNSTHFGLPGILRARVRFNALGVKNRSFGATSVQQSDASQYSTGIAKIDKYSNLVAVSGNNSVPQFYNFSSYWADWQTYEIWRWDGGCKFINVSGTDTVESSYYSTNDKYLYVHVCGSIIEINVDWMAVREYASPEPVATVGSEHPIMWGILALCIPNNGSFTNDSTPTFGWNDADCALTYHLQVADNEDFLTPKINDSTLIISTYTPLIGMSDTLYYWRVRVSRYFVWNQPVWSDWSEVWNFTIDTKSPGIPALISPVAGTWFNRYPVTFQWAEVTLSCKNVLSPTEIRYLLEVDTSTAFATPIVDTVTTTYDTWTLDEGKYYWRIMAFDIAGNYGDFSTPDSFGIDVNPPGIFSLIEPADYTWINATRPTFTWHATLDQLSGLSKYKIYVDEILRDSSADTLWVANFDIHEGYHDWHVIAYDDAGNYRESEQTPTFGVDTTAPIFSETLMWSDTGFQGPYLITTNILETISGVDSALLYYRFDDGEWQFTPMHVVSSIKYGAEVPKAPNSNTTICYYLKVKDLATNITFDPKGAPDSTYSFIGSQVEVAQKELYGIPVNFVLHQNIPNPFNGHTTIRYQLPTESHITLKIYNATGTLIKILVNAKEKMGYHEVIWDSRDDRDQRAAKGIYFYCMETDNFRDIKKLILIR